MKRLAAIAVSLLTLLAVTTIPTSRANVSETVTYHWKEDVKVYDSTISVELSIPTTLSVEGLPDRAKPGEVFAFKVSTTLVKGAQIKVGEEAFNIDEALEVSMKHAENVDLSSVKPLVKKALAYIIRAELGLDESKAMELSSILTEYTNLALKNSLEVEVVVEGKAAADPGKLKIWFDEPVEGRLNVDKAAEGVVKLTYKPQWVIVLAIDFTAQVYENPTVGPLISRLSSLIGLPFERDLGKSRGDRTITHVVTIYSLPRLTSSQIGMIVLLVVAACVIAVGLIIKFPRKPRWR